MDLHPEILDCGIVAAIKWQAKEFCERERIRYRVTCDSDKIPLDSDLSVAIFRVFQIRTVSVKQSTINFKRKNGITFRVLVRLPCFWVFWRVER